MRVIELGIAGIFSLLNNVYLPQINRTIMLVSKGHCVKITQLSGLKQQKALLSQTCSQGIGRSMSLPKDLDKDPSLPLGASHDSQQSFTFLGLELFQSHFEIHLHMTFFFLCPELSPFPYKDTSH